MSDIEINMEDTNNTEQNSGTPTILVDDTIDIIIEDIQEVNLHEANSSREVFITYQSANW